MKRFRLLTGDCIEVMRRLEDASVDAIVTDPPYGLEFMGKEWDSFKTGRSAKYSKGGNLDKEQIGARKGKGGAGPSYVNRPAKRCANCGRQAWSGSPCQCDEPQWQIDNSPLHAFQAWTEEWAREAFRVLKPGGHLLAFGGSRTYHRLAAAVEDAGFEIRDQIMWLYGSGFPKSLDVSKAIDKQRDEDRAPRVAVTSWTKEQCELRGWTRAKLCKHFGVKNNPVQSWTETNPDYAVVPTLEVWCELKKLVGFGDDMDAEVWRLNGRKGQPGENWFKREVVGTANATHLEVAPGEGRERPKTELDITAPATDRAAQWEGWGTALKPAHEPIVVARKPLIGTVAQNVLKHGTGALNIQASRVEGERWPANIILNKEAGEMLDEQQEGASRFFYCPKASKKERSAGTDKNIHPTVKPVELMRYLCRLVTPPGGVILDPFLGSGSTGCAVAAENNDQNPDWGFIGIEREAEYMDIAKARIKHWRNLKPDAKPDSPAKPVQQMQLGEEVQS